MDVNEIAALVGGTVEGDGATVISGAASVGEAQPGDLVFAETERFLQAALASPAAAVLTALRPAENPKAKPLILVEDARAAFVRVLESLEPPLTVPLGIHPTAQVGKNVQMGTDVSLGPHVSVGDGVTLGNRVVLLPGVCVGDDSIIGDDTVLFPNVVLYPRVTVGKRCRLHAGCVIGADGFGYIPVGRALRKVPQLGTVEIGDDVEIGANACVDRAKTSKTVIGSGTKLDNLVHVGHNGRIGQSCILVAQVGLAGGVTLGNGVMLGGQAGVNPHVSIGDGARVGGQAGVIGNVPAGATVSGYPARPHTAKMREYAAVSKLPDLLKRVRDLEKRLASLDGGSASAGEEKE